MPQHKPQTSDALRQPLTQEGAFAPMGTMASHASAPSIKAVLFDYGLVLSGPPDPDAWAEMLAVFGTSEEAFHAAYWTPRHDYDRGTLNGNTYWHQVAQILAHQLSAEEHQQLLAADVALWTRPNEPMIDWAAQLQAAGVRTGILSNLGDAMETGILARFSWLGDFAHHTFSHRLHLAKPEAAIYAHAAQGLQTSPEHVLFIDDRQENIEAAHEVGMQAIQYLNHQQFTGAMRQAGLEALLSPATKGGAPPR